MKVMLVDISLCNGCFNCQLACKDEHVDNDWTPYAKPQPDMGHFWMHTQLVERGQCPKVKVSYIPRPCFQCQEATCVKESPSGVVYQRKDGIVIIDPEKSKGMKQIVDTCPYHRIYWNETLGIPQKCTFCAHLLDKGWKEPRCVEACPTGALKFGEYSKLAGEIKAKKAVVMHPEFGLEPSVYYAALPKKFVAGTVVLGDSDECAENVSATLVSQRGKKAVAKTNNYGDFEFEGLDANKKFSVRLELPGYAPKELSVETSKDIYLGDIVLTKA